MRPILSLCLLATPLVASPINDQAMAASKRYAKSHPKLSLQYAGAAAHASDAVSFATRYAIAQARYREGSLDNLGWTIDELFRLNLSPSDLNRGLSLSFNVLWDRGEDAKIVQAYQRFQNHKVFKNFNEDGRQALARSLEKNGDRAAAEEIWEKLLENFPISPESRWAMNKLENNECDNRRPRPLHLSLLRRLSRNSSIDPGLADWLLAQLDRPVQPAKGPPVILSAIDKLEATYYLRFFEQAVQDGELMLGEKPNEADTIRILKVLGDANSSLGRYSSALSQYARADFLTGGLDREIRESYTSTLTKTGNFTLAARHYAMLPSKRNGVDNTWQVFWNHYRSGDHKASFNALKSMPAQASSRRDPFLRDATVYWKGRLLMKLGREADAKKMWSQFTDHRSVWFYRTRAATALGTKAKLVTITNNEREIPANESINQLYDGKPLFAHNPSLTRPKRFGSLSRG